MLVSIHALHNFPASNLNRDDTGAPKTQYFGGFERARISSQCQKYAWRHAWNEKQLPLPQAFESLGIRTRELPAMVLDRLKKKGLEDESLLAVISEKLIAFGKSDKAGGDEGDKKDKKGKKSKAEPAKAAIPHTQQILFYSPNEIDAIADSIYTYIEENGCDAETFQSLSQKALSSVYKTLKVLPMSLDVSLFGRMTTDNSMRTVESAIQVAHALSTNALLPESDFFVAVDDMTLARKETGTGMLMHFDFNSSCYYSYASLNLDQWAENLAIGRKEDANAIIRDVLPSVIQTIALVNPTGKQNSFAANTAPSTILVEVIDNNIPVSYANAFVSPVQPTITEDICKESETALLSFVEKTRQQYSPLLGGKRFLLATQDNPVLPADTTRLTSLPELLQAVSQAI